MTQYCQIYYLFFVLSIVIHEKKNIKKQLKKGQSFLSSQGNNTKGERFTGPYPQPIPRQPTTERVSKLFFHSKASSNDPKVAAERRSEERTKDAPTNTVSLCTVGSMSVITWLGNKEVASAIERMRKYLQPARTEHFF